MKNKFSYKESFLLKYYFSIGYILDKKKRRLHSNILHIYGRCCQSWKLLPVAGLPSGPLYQLAYHFVQSCSGTKCYHEAIFHYWWLMICCSFLTFEPSFMAAGSGFWPFAVLPSLYEV